MKIGLFLRDSISVASVRLRLFDPLAQFLEHELRCAFGFTETGQEICNPDVLNWAEVLVIQRAFPGPDTEMICNAMISSGKPIVYETDDLLTQAADNVLFRRSEPFVNKMAFVAALVTVTTPPLAAHFKRFNANVVTLPNYMNDKLWGPHIVNPNSRRAKRVRIGYFGSAAHLLDINSLRGILLKLADKHPNLDLCFYGCKPNAVEHLKCFSFSPAHFDYALFPENISKLKLDIGLAPLLPTPLNKCRSPIKYFDYALSGSVCVASTAGPFDAVIEHGVTGFLCSTPEEWFEVLDKLVQDRELRNNVALNAQRSVLQNWMLSDHAQLWQTEYEKLPH